MQTPDAIYPLPTQSHRPICISTNIPFQDKDFGPPDSQLRGSCEASHACTYYDGVIALLSCFSRGRCALH